MARYLYLVSVPKNGRMLSTPFLTDKKHALTIGRTLQGVVHRAQKATFDGGTSFGIDGPTFRAQADVVADFTVRTFDVFWAPEGRKVATVVARDEHAAKRMAPKPYRKFLGELYAVVVEGN
jgi:hypothetical protein